MVLREFYCQIMHVHSFLYCNLLFMTIVVSIECIPMVDSFVYDFNS